MGVLVPETFNLDTLANEAERRVVRSFLDRLNDSWLVLPDVGFQGRRKEHQIDVVLVNRDLGIVAVEIKSHRMSIVGGRWCDRRGGEVIPQPPFQAKDNAYGLRNLIRKNVEDLEHLHVHYGIALPNTVAIDGSIGTDLDPSQVILSGALDDPADAIEHLIASGHVSSSLDDAVEAVVRFLRPDANFSYDPEARSRHARSRLDDLAATQVRTLETLDANRRVVVHGAAGTGKTRLGLAWARRAFARGERVMFTCFNEPLAEHLRDVAVEDEDFVVGPFLRLALGLDGIPALEVPADADNDWWNGTALDHLRDNWHRVEDRFGTIVVDEAQDFDPRWLELLESLLGRDGSPGRFLLLADPAQALFDRGFTLPSADDGWTQAELTVNCRNAREIGTLLRRRLGGAASPVEAPDALGVAFVAVGADADTEIVEAVQRVIDEHVLAERDPDGIMVLTFTTRLRDLLSDALGLHPWEERDRGIVCQTIHRSKGLETDTAVLVADRSDVSEGVLYVGVSRAVSELVVVGPSGLGSRLGLSDPGGSLRARRDQSAGATPANAATRSRSSDADDLAVDPTST